MDQLRVVVAKPLAAEYVERIRSAEPRIDLVIEPDLLPPMRWPSDHEGDPAFRRNVAALRVGVPEFEGAEHFRVAAPERPATEDVIRCLP